MAAVLGLYMLSIIFLIAITGEAMSGALAAGRRNMDMFGVAFVAFVTALGGGTVRDILLGNFPVVWTQHMLYIYLTVGAGVATMFIAHFVQRLRMMFLLTDAMGLVAFTIIGCDVALKLGYEIPVVIMSGITTGIFGGILRDILCGSTPQVLREELYASVSILVALVYLLMLYFKVPEGITLAVAFITGLSVRMLAIKFKWSLPVFSYDPEKWK